MVFERGPQGKVHAPAYRDGCYHGRLTDCCLLCMLRIGFSSPTAPIRYRIRNARSDREHDLVGERVVVPYLDRSVAHPMIDYREGTIDEVHVLSGDEPEIVTIELDENEYVHVDWLPAQPSEALEA